MVGHEKRMRVPLPVGRSQGIEASTDLEELPGFHPTGKLTLHVSRIDVAGQEKATLEEGLFSDALEKLLEPHGSKIPLVASYCNA
jgi:hypothetical protein